ncbi:uncharacterized protein ISCGN_016744 [Ixodes scapularis]
MPPGRSTTGEEVQEWRPLAATSGTNAVWKTYPPTAVISAFASMKGNDARIGKGLVFLTQLVCLAACNQWEPEELHHKSERDAHPALLRGWCLEEGRSAPKVNAMAGIALRLGPCGTGGSQVIKEDRTSAHSETM